ncbi:hypothetical protein PPERSA_08237 [Pseudocohnilembus persalinus]|uniref:Rubisco LSMT substrate-binding domain-containing protein n=1 Tax=Pseudocohnilembus persalinus TaxID=266149 RepID=A0A0V0QGB3_PSEPJ|nr:hypothetical protein PPERSA_08237 [Pseudocohnilembus persalinus]|eukprot:KRX01136.1 hypothetical protein PPERSA_08237 [Pseudocohnilembus persalinus]
MQKKTTTIKTSTKPKSQVPPAKQPLKAESKGTNLASKTSGTNNLQKGCQKQIGSTTQISSKNGINAQISNDIKIPSAPSDMVYVQDKQINEQATQIAQKEEIYNIFKNWFVDNGGKIQGLQFPTAFGNSGYLGIAADQDLKANSSIISIPQKLVISTEKIRKLPDYKSIISENQQLFCQNDNEEGDFMVLSLFLVVEKSKQEKSFWKPYLDICANPVTLLQWDEKEIKQFQDPYLEKQQQEYQIEIELLWQAFEKVAQKYPQLLPKNSFNRETFIWAYEVAMTRCFGWTLPGTFLLPMADFLNHNKRGCVYFIVNEKLEKNSDDYKGYKVKKQAVDLSLMKKFQYDEEQLNLIHEQENDLIQYLEFFGTKVKMPMSLKQAKYYEKEDLMNYVRQINYKRLEEKQDEQIWNQSYFSTSEEEDNDSDSEDESIAKNSDYNSMKQKENYEITQSLISKFQNPENEQEKKMTEELKTIQMNRIQSLEQFKKNRYLSQLQDNKWEWYDPEDNDNYINFVTQKPVKKGQQIFNCYGRRSNKGLLLWYGFCLIDNPYDSVVFRLIEEWETQPYDQFKIFNDYISYNEWEEDKYKYQGVVYDIEQFTKEFRLKKSKIAEDFITFLRVKLLKVYKESDFFQVKITLPSSFQFEIQVLEAGLKYMKQIQKSKEVSPLEEDLKLLEQPNLPWKLRFAIIFRKEQKEIIKIQIQLFQLAISILQEIKLNKTSIKEAYMKKYQCDQGQTEEEMRLYREKLRDYLRQIYIGILTKPTKKKYI